MMYYRPYRRSNTIDVGYYGTIVYTDYETYFVQYYCERAWFDFFTKEYIDIFTKEGVTLLPATTLALIKTKLQSMMPVFQTTDIVTAKDVNCHILPTWGFLF